MKIVELLSSSNHSIKVEFASCYGNQQIQSFYEQLDTKMPKIIWSSTM